MNRFFSLLKSVTGAFLGVQSGKQLDNDAEEKSVWPFVITGIFMTVLLVIGIAAAVRIVLTNISG
ncbi:DUF2970 domain-containing protein [Pseudomaricurvus sp. HS19]|uniref:DUF2970 domain-containing protein n=1 Tax=Pseudomaricurvus sp. HS19 TaxID=2692626 RepID=UPI001370E4CE|nr:DUF2970 domain-containing protein [Pseudomaricurvus sp. HS19]MYM63590.1 DUF2970 domain-containing protein [Pseudomaricurvus sp. HS19]